MKQLCKGMAVAVALSAIGVAQAEEQAGCAETQRLTYIDSRVFDAGVEQVLRRGCNNLDIAVITDVPFDKVPDRIDRWLEKVVSAGGGFAVVPQEPPKEPVRLTATRGLLGLGMGVSTEVLKSTADTVTTAYSYVKKFKAERAQKEFNRMAAEYTVIMYVHPETKMIRGIRFTRDAEVGAVGESDAPQEIGK